MGQPIVDPITGLPYDITNPLIDQLPMDSTPIPLDDWATQGTISQYYYPDMIPATLATIGAQDRTNVQKAQSLQTDGDHALRVQVANASDIGGGGGVSAIVARQIPQQAPLGTIATFTRAPFAERYLYGFIMSMFTNDLPGTLSADFCGGFIEPVRPGPVPNITLYMRWLIRNSTTQGGLEMHESKMYPMPIDLLGSLGAGPYVFQTIGEAPPQAVLLVQLLIGN